MISVSVRSAASQSVSGPAYQLVVFARMQVSGVVGDLIDPAQPAGRLVGDRIAARDEAQCYGRMPLRVYPSEENPQEPEPFNLTEVNRKLAKLGR